MHWPLIGSETDFGIYKMWKTRLEIIKMDKKDVQ